MACAYTVAEAGSTIASEVKRLSKACLTDGRMPAASSPGSSMLQTSRLHTMGTSFSRERSVGRLYTTLT
eukprot:scaffold1821_cov344-Pavlova_lutheri.AAC.17